MSTIPFGDFSLSFTVQVLLSLQLCFSKFQSPVMFIVEDKCFLAKLLGILHSVSTLWSNAQWSFLQVSKV